MGKETLLDPQIDAGLILLKELDNSSLDIQSALWFYYPDLDKWKLLLFSPDFDPNKASAQYANIFNVLNKTNTKGALSFDSIQLVFKNDKILNLLKNIIHVKGESKIRMTSNYLNGFYVDDAMIYRNTIH